ncbi:MAG: hypothetical protein U0271_35220 [Polyangiaceae bacterium]
MREYTRLQAALVEVATRAYPDLVDIVGRNPATKRIPRTGQLELDGEVWSYVWHGRGLRFRDPHGVVVDCHVAVEEARGVDAWRLMLYCESRSIVSVEYGSDTARADDNAAMSRLLEESCRRGKLRRVSTTGWSGYTVFVPTTQWLEYE